MNVLLKLVVWDSWAFCACKVEDLVSLNIF